MATENSTSHVNDGSSVEVASLPKKRRGSSAPSALRRLFGSRRLRCSIATPEKSVATNQVEALIERTSFRLNLAPGEEFPGGLVRVHARVKADELPLSTRLNFRLGDSFQESDHVWLPAGIDGVILQTIALPRGVKELLLTAFLPKRAVEVLSFSVCEVGSVKRLVSHAFALIKYHIHHPYMVVSKIKKAWMLWKRGGFKAVLGRLKKQDGYIEWVAQFDTLTERDRVLIRERLETLEYQPLISVLLPVYNPPETFLRAAIESVTRQLYQNWELCIADDKSPNPTVRRVIEEYAKQDSRIKYVFRDQNGHIAEASNSAAKLASGEFFGLLDHDDELTEHALYMVVEELNRNPDADLIFSDEDKLSEGGVRKDPYFKSGWNPELMLVHNCVCHFQVVRAELFRSIGGFRKGFDGAQDWDLTLRISENTSPARIRHIPHVLYHWRILSGSTAKDTAAKPYVTAAQIKAVSEHLERRGDTGAVVESRNDLSMLRVRYKVPSPEPLVSLIIPTHNQVTLLEQCVDGILSKTDYRNVEVIIVDNRSNDRATLEYLKTIPLQDSRVSVLRDTGSFNFSRINNRAVASSKGEILGFINNDIQVTHPEWLSEMVSNVTRQNVAAVGARLLFPNGTVQHVGVVTGMGGIAGHTMKGMLMQNGGYFCRAIIPQNLSAVTAACMLVQRSAFEGVGGFDEKDLAVAFNDVDLCLKLRKAGHLIVYTPFAELIHHESVSRGYEDTPEKVARFESETETMEKRWGKTLLQDPYFNPNFRLDTHDVVIAWPPTVARPWEGQLSQKSNTRSEDVGNKAAA